MASYDESPPDEGYSEDPLTVGPSGSMPPHLARMTVPERTGRPGTEQRSYMRNEADMTTI